MAVISEVIKTGNDRVIGFVLHAPGALNLEELGLYADKNFYELDIIKDEHLADTVKEDIQ